MIVHVMGGRGFQQWGYLLCSPLASARPGRFGPLPKLPGLPAGPPLAAQLAARTPAASTRVRPVRKMCPRFIALIAHWFRLSARIDPAGHASIRFAELHAVTEKRCRHDEQALYHRRVPDHQTRYPQ